MGLTGRPRAEHQWHMPHDYDIRAEESETPANRRPPEYRTFERSRKRLRSNLVRASKSRGSRETKTPRHGPTAGPSHSQRRAEVQEVAPRIGSVASHSAEAMSCGDGEDSDTVRAEVLPRTKQLEVAAADGIQGL